MIKKILNIFLVLLCLSGFAQERSFQIRNINNMEVKLSDLFSAAVTERNYYSPDAGINDMSVYGDLNGEYDVTKWLEIGATGRFVGYKRIDGWHMEQRPMVYGNISASLGRVGLDLNNRLEYKISKYYNDFLRHKNLINLEYSPFNLNWLKLYAAEEFFYNFNNDRLNRTRLSSGTKLTFNRYFEMKCFYMLESCKTYSTWARTDIFGFNLYFDL